MGKTVVSAAILLRYRDRTGTTPRPRYWKPIQTGIEQDDDTSTVRRLTGCASHEVLDEGVRLERAVSPHLAARLSGRAIDVPSVLAVVAAQPAVDRWVVEGAGGVLVPLHDSTTVADFMIALALPAVVVARSSLGTINHTLLTLEALRTRGIRVAGVVMVGQPDSENRRAIEAFGATVVLGELPLMHPLAPEALANWARRDLDRDGRLEDCFA